MPEVRIVHALAAISRRLRYRSVLWASAAGGAAFGTALVLGSVFAADGTPAAGWSAAAGVATAAAFVWMGWRQSLRRSAAAIERVFGSMDNLVVTAAEIIERPYPVRADIQREILRQADERIDRADLSRAAGLSQPVAVAAAVLIGCAVLLLGIPRGALPVEEGVIPPGASPGGIARVSVRVSPPAYAGQPDATFEDPVRVTALAGSRVTIEVQAGAVRVVAEAVGSPAIEMERQQGRFVGAFVASTSVGLAVRAEGTQGSDARFISLIVTPDESPSVRVLAPARDVAISGPDRLISLAIESSDDLGLASLALRYTTASGGGEALAFTSGEVPLSLERVDGRHWTATARWSLDALQLSDGDAVVYSAVARDRNPEGHAVHSEQYVIEIGRAAVSAGAGFGLPADEKTGAISQQMVIYKTEELLAMRARPAPDAWLEQTRMLAIEQRMVRAEVVFLGGGEVQDEVEEAAHSDELAEGRLENAGRAEMLRAINFMSRAEAQLNDGRAADALAFERQALRSLEIAFDRRRYFLRTVSDRSRIDPSRRLTGSLQDARSWTRAVSRTRAPVVLQVQREVMTELADSIANRVTNGAGIAARVAGLDPESSALQSAAVGLATAATPEQYRLAAQVAMQAVSTQAQAALASPADVRWPADPLTGYLADALGQKLRRDRQ